jgi:hypothetical protein
MSGKENFQPQIINNGQSMNAMPGFQSLNQLTFPLSTYTQQFNNDNQRINHQDSRALNELLTIINNSIDTRRQMTRTMNNN